MKTKLLLTISIAIQGAFVQAQLTVSYTSNAHVPCDTCIDLQANISGGVPPYTYQWQSSSLLLNDTGEIATYCNGNPETFGDDTLTLIVTDANSDQASYGTTAANLMSTTNLVSPPLCIVTVDSVTGKNLIVWEQTTDSSVVSYNLYKQSTSGVFVVMANIPRSNFSVFVDTLSNPAQKSDMYQISTIDSCGFESRLDANTPVNSIHLIVSAGIPPAWNLTWNFTQGFPIAKYRIWRSTIPSNPVLIDSVANSVNAYTDLTPPAGVLYYTLEAISGAVCNPSIRSRADSTYSSSFSNVADNGISNISENDFTKNLKAFPNPFSFETTLTSKDDFKNANITAYNIYGQAVKQMKNVSGSTIVFNRDGLPDGIYFIVLTQNNKIYIADKLVITNN